LVIPPICWLGFRWTNSLTMCVSAVKASFFCFCAYKQQRLTKWERFLKKFLSCDLLVLCSLTCLRALCCHRHSIQSMACKTIQGKRTTDWYEVAYFFLKCNNVMQRIAMAANFTSSSDSASNWF
jgi:hypothetical protein